MRRIADRRARIHCFVVCTGLTLGACGGQKSQATPDTRSPSVPATSSPSRSQTAPTAAGKAPCPATGQWSDCAVFQALDRAGLAPRHDSSQSVVTVAPLIQSGARLLLGGAELDVFVYADSSARRADESRLDKTKFIEATDEPTLRGEPTLIRNDNLLAVLRSRNDHQRERVSDALSAGPPQPSGASTLPQTKVPR